MLSILMGFMKVIFVDEINYTYCMLIGLMLLLIQILFLLPSRLIVKLGMGIFFKSSTISNGTVWDK